MSVSFPPGRPWSRKLSERLHDLVRDAEEVYNAEVTVLPPSHSCYEEGYAEGHNVGYQSAEADAEVRRPG